MIEVIDELGYGGGYDWESFQLGKDENGVYYWRSGAGCSCYGIDDEPWVAINSNADFDLMSSDAERFGRESSYSSSADATEFLAEAYKLINPRAL